MSDKKRCWFQIHLSTALVLMFVAGGVIGVNLIRDHENTFGWPVRLFRDDAMHGLLYRTSGGLKYALYDIWRGEHAYAKDLYYFWPFLIINALCWTVIITIIAITLEYQIRRHKKQLTANK